LKKSDQPFLKRVGAVFGEMSTLTQKFRCAFMTEGIRKKDESGLPPDIKLQVGQPTDLKPGPATDFFKQTSKVGVTLSVEVEAADSEAARHIADKRLGELFAAKNLFSIDARYGIKESNALVDDGNGYQAIVGPRRLGSHYLGSYDARLLKTDLLLRVTNHLQNVYPSDALQLAAAMEYHRLALLATSDEARLVNLWIALEALCQGGEGSIIERVWTRIAPCVAIDNVRRNLISLSIYVRNLWTDADRGQFLALFPNSEKDHLKPEDLTAVLLLNEGHDNLKKLTQLCLKHPLITHRLFRAKSMMLNEPAAVKANVEYTRQNVEWQIKRIYRIRNAIVHTGSANLLLPQLTQHLHCYLVKAIQSILIDLDRQPLWSIRDSMEHRGRLFEHFVALYSKTPGHKIGAESIVNPEASLSRQSEPFAWLPPPPAPAAGAAPQPAAATAPVPSPAAPAVATVPVVKAASPPANPPKGSS